MSIIDLLRVSAYVDRYQGDFLEKNYKKIRGFFPPLKAYLLVLILVTE